MIAPQGAYRLVGVHGAHFVTAGLTPRVDGVLTVTGIVGADVDAPRAREAVCLATRNALEAVTAAAPPGHRIGRVAEFTVYLATSTGFTDHSAIADAGSAEIERLGPDVMGVRTTVGVASLPGGSCCEVRIAGTYVAPETGALP